MKALEKELRTEAYNNLRRRYDKNELSHIKFSKAEIIRRFQEKFPHKPLSPKSSLYSEQYISNSELLQFVRELTISKKIPKEMESVEKAFYRKVKNCKS